MLEQAMRLAHMAYTKALNAIIPELDKFAAIKEKRARRRQISQSLKRVNTRFILPAPLGNAAKSGLIQDLEGQLLSNLELREKQQITSPPSVRRINADSGAYAEAVDQLAQSLTLEQETIARDRLMTEAKAGILRPVFFPRNGVSDGFLLLHHPDRNRYGIWLNLFPQSSRYYERRRIEGWADIRTGELSALPAGTGALLPIEFAGDFQLKEFIEKGEPKTAKLVKKMKYSRCILLSLMSGNRSRQNVG